MMTRRLLVSVLTMSMALGVALSPAVAAQDSDIQLVPVEDATFGVRSVAPEGWASIGRGAFTRGTLPEDRALVAFQAFPLSADQIWPGILPQIARTEVPEATGDLSTDAFDWTLYAVPVELPGASVGVEIAMAEADGSTYLVFFQAEADDFALLRDSIFIPAVESFALLETVPTADPSALAYTTEEVAFPGGAPDVELAGTLTLPRGDGPHPVVVLMSGSGPQDRDESLAGVTALKPFALIADALSSAGVGVLRYDDRGVGASTGRYEGATVSELASDGSAAIDYVSTRDDIDPDRIGVLGHSEGGYYAAMIVPDDPRISFAVLMAPPTVNGVDLLVAQNEAVARSAGSSPEEIEAIVAAAEVALPAAAEGDRAAVEDVIRAAAEDAWDDADADARAILGERDAFVERRLEFQLATLLSDWYRSLLAYDPQPDLARLTVPVLGLFGAKDVQVILQQNEPALRDALEEAANGDFKIIVFPNANHIFQESVSGAVSEYSELAPEFTPDFLPALVDWVTRQVGIEVAE